MSNMSYCRYQNTLADLRDCHEHLDDECDSEMEIKARKELIELCAKIAKEHEGRI